MALFTPEVQDIGGTNVRAYNPPVMDYSGIADIGRILASAIPQKPQMSAEERDAAALQPLADIYAKGEEIRAEKGDAYADTFIKMSKINFLRKNPNLATKVTAFENAQAALGVEENVFETEVNATVDAFRKTEDGALKAQLRLNEYTDRTGNFDAAGYNAALFADALEYNTQQAMLKSIQNEKIAKEDKDNKIITNIVKNFKDNVDAPTNTLLRSDQGLMKTLELIQQGGVDTPEAMVRAAGLLSVEEANRKAKLKAKLSENGIIKTDAEIDNLMKQANPALYYNITALESLSTLDEKYLKQMKDATMVGWVTRVPADSATALSLLNPEAWSLYRENALITEETLTQMKDEEISKMFDPNVEFVPVAWKNVNTAPALLPENYSPADVSSKEQELILDMFSPETKKFVQGSNDATKESVLAKTKAFLDIYKKGDIGTKIPGNLQAQALSHAYAIQVVGTEVETAANAKNINTIFGDKALTFISDMAQEDPTIGASLNKDASIYAQYEAKKQLARFNQLYVGQIQNDPSSSPFILEEEGNILNLKIRPQFEDDPFIKQAKQSDRFVVGRGVAVRLPENTEIFSIFSRWATTGIDGLASATTTDQSEEMVSRIKNIQLLYQNSFRLEEAHGKKVREFILNQANTIGLR